MTTQSHQISFTMEKKICLITGANAGIGKAAAIQLAQAGHHVILGCRNSQRGQQALESVRAASGSSGVSLLVLD
ncbi:MAG TPA: short-chain dehydrogenase, partial [Cytophagales bacterium]|nr:short-chain dehydrogenase [Cytophagales bacterium]